MSRPFRARRGGVVRGQVPAYAAGILTNLAGQLVELLSDGEATGEVRDPLEEIVGLDSEREAPDDAALRRLLPDAHRDDPEVSAEFRRFTERTLRTGKIADARVVIDTLAGAGYDETMAPAELVDFVLDRDTMRSWMRSLTDLRLTLAERLSVTADDEDYWAGLPGDDPRRQVYEIYGWLGYLLEDLVGAAAR
ncbi:MAG: DUF2017 domain-containing protein [Sciscionella sp.]